MLTDSPHNKRPRGLNADAFFYLKFAIIIIGLCVTIEARKRN